MSTEGGNEKMIITNDGATILKSVYVDNPAAKILIDISKTQDTFITFYPSGHILGSAFILIEVAGKTFLFTNDLGRNNHPILVPPQLPPDINTYF